MTAKCEYVSIRFKVRGASRRQLHSQEVVERATVSIRFKVRGASRPIVGSGIVKKMIVSIRFKVRGASRLRGVVRPRTTVHRVSIRFKVRGASRPYPLARRPDKPCCGGFTHHPSSPPSNQRTEPVLKGVKPLVKCHTHLKPFLVVLQHPCPGVSPKHPAGSRERRIPPTLPPRHPIP